MRLQFTQAHRPRFAGEFGTLRSAKPAKPSVEGPRPQDWPHFSANCDEELSAVDDLLSGIPKRWKKEPALSCRTWANSGGFLMSGQRGNTGSELAGRARERRKRGSGDIVDF